MADKNYIGVVALTLPRAKKELALLRKASDTLGELLEKEAEAALQPIVLRSVIRDLSGQKPEEDGVLGLGRLLNQPPEDKRYAELKFHLPPLVWSSLFLSGYSVLEHYMVSTCDQFDTLFDWRAKPNHLRGLGVGRCKTYLSV